MFKQWYMRVFETDSLGKHLNDGTFHDLYVALHEGNDIYEEIGVVDSVVRERLLSELANRLGVDYSVIYNMLVNN